MDATRLAELRLCRDRNGRAERSEDMRHQKWIAAGAPLAALFLVPAPAGAEERWTDANFMAAANVTVHRGPQAIMVVSGVPHRGDGRHDGGHDGRRHHPAEDGFFGGDLCPHGS